MVHCLTWAGGAHVLLDRFDLPALTEAAIVAHCRARLGGFKVPRSVAFRDEPLPKSGAGKVLKRLL
jgi:acyl-CoA synthetase (AMP-forming)/AMP-acid ligase II